MDGAVKNGFNTLVVLGPTASGKTALAVGLARRFGGEILSADSRQVYRGLDVGSGKDLAEYGMGADRVPCHLIDIADLSEEFSVYHYQRACYETWEELQGRGALPIVCGGTGLYLEAVLSGYRMVDVAPDAALRAELAQLDDEALLARLATLRPEQHNSTDTLDRERCVRAIEIALYSQSHDAPPAPPIRPLILGAAWPRAVLWERIEKRLRERMAHGLIEEVEGLHGAGVSWARLENLGLEYRYCAAYLQGSIRNRNDLIQKLNVAIRQFAKRQDTWFRRMERRGHVIHWIDEARLALAQEVVQEHG